MGNTFHFHPLHPHSTHAQLALLWLDSSCRTCLRPPPGFRAPGEASGPWAGPTPRSGKPRHGWRSQRLDGRAPQHRGGGRRAGGFGGRLSRYVGEALCFYDRRKEPAEGRAGITQQAAAPGRPCYAQPEAHYTASARAALPPPVLPSGCMAVPRSRGSSQKKKRRQKEGWAVD